MQQNYGDTPDTALAALADERPLDPIEGPYGANIVVNIDKRVPDAYRYDETQKECQARYPNDATMARRCTSETHALESAYWKGDMTLPQLKHEIKKRRPAKLPDRPAGKWIPTPGYTFLPDPVPKGPPPWWKAGGVDWRVIGGVGGGLLVLTLLLRNER
jgi:alkanesulfonate monooxygenase SsuD/methylene tetrahydromethanopterin reductase-like flavin-dependent oxidoreductase (luciferase family)